MEAYSHSWIAKQKQTHRKKYAGQSQPVRVTSACVLGARSRLVRVFSGLSSAKTRLETRGISHAVTRNWKGKENTPVEEVFGHLRDVFERKSGVAVAGSAGEVRVTGARVARG